MPTKNDFKKIREQLKRVISRAEKDEISDIDSPSSVNNINKLIAKYRVQLAEIGGSKGNTKDYNQALRGLMALRVSLSRYFREKQQKLLDKDYREQIKENREFSAEMMLSLDAARKKISESVDAFNGNTVKLQKLQDELQGVQLQLNNVDREIKDETQKFEDAVQPVQKELDAQIDSVLGETPIPGPPIPRPTFKGCVHKAYEQSMVAGETRDVSEIFGVQINGEFSRFTKSLRERALSHELESVEAKIASLNEVQQSFMKRFTGGDLNLTGLVSGLERISSLQSEKEKLEEKRDVLEEKIEDITGKELKGSVLGAASTLFSKAKDSMGLEEDGPAAGATAATPFDMDPATLLKKLKRE